MTPYPLRVRANLKGSIDMVPIRTATRIPRRKVGEVAGHVQGPAFGFVLKPAASLLSIGFL